jgi:hypothetical protein
MTFTADEGFSFFGGVNEEEAAIAEGVNEKRNAGNKS